MLSVVIIVLVCAGFATGYAVRARLSRRRHTRRIVLPHAVHFPAPQPPPSKPTEVSSAEDK